jgi:hypothetical protein
VLQLAESSLVLLLAGAPQVLLLAEALQLVSPAFRAGGKTKKLVQQRQLRSPID